MSFISTSIEPWLPVQNAAKALQFYKAAFDAIEIYRMEDPGAGLVVKLSIDGAGFWLSGSTVENQSADKKALEGNIRMVLTVSDPDVFFVKALQAGATEVSPVGEEYGWRLGRLIDPFGLHWEIGHPLSH